MKLFIAKTAGFCMGVRRAVDLVLGAPGKHEAPIYTFGPLIHNPQVLELLEEKGITVLNTIPESGSGTVLIRAHGVPPEIKEGLTDAGFKVIDATCPRVIKVQTIIRKHARQGCAAIIVGDEDHPEVTGLLGYAGARGFVVGSLEELEALPPFDKAIIVAQTTQNTRLFEAIGQWAGERFPHYKVFDTICDSTAKRQAEVKQLAASMDAVVVVGGRDSGNTRRLAEIAGQNGKPSFHVETESDLDARTLASARRVGITAGASTPNWIIKRIYRSLETIPLKKKRDWRQGLLKLQRSLLLTNLYVSLGAACLCFACTKLLEIERFAPYVLISFLYVQSMHILNHLIGSKADRFNDPARAAFYRRYKYLLTLLAVVAGGAGLVVAYTLGWLPFLILLIMSVTGLSYNLRLVPAPAGLFSSKYQRIRDIPSSKTILIAVAWGVVTSLLPSIAESHGSVGATLLVFVWASGMVFVRTAFFDILDMQGDRIVGRETIPILLGETRAMRLLMHILIASMGLLFLTRAFHITPG
ncbi:MAG: 4-hydroxy-3-methylbut-2-enyl diphosphate reductase, partial [Desulfobacterales bacterium]|nr:4-hydroxy-3-methylbut-2-enyl diphosphate reductase [Desulfobacterales bacterium]